MPYIVDTLPEGVTGVEISDGIALQYSNRMKYRTICTPGTGERHECDVHSISYEKDTHVIKSSVGYFPTLAKIFIRTQIDDDVTMHESFSIPTILAIANCLNACINKNIESIGEHMNDVHS